MRCSNQRELQIKAATLSLRRMKGLFVFLTVVLPVLASAGGGAYLASAAYFGPAFASYSWAIRFLLAAIAFVVGAALVRFAFAPITRALIRLSLRCGR